MTADLWTAVFLALGVAIEWLCCLGLWAGRRPLDKLHFIGPAASAGPLLFGIAILISEPGQTIRKFFLILIILALTGPVLTHATARAAYLRATKPGGEKEK